MTTPELSGVPVLILKEGASRSRGRDTQRACMYEARKAILTVVRKLRKEGINVRKPEIQITNVVASAILNGIIDLDRLYSKMDGKIIFEPEQFPGAIYRMESPSVVFLIFSNGKIVCVGAKKEEDICEAIENLRQKLEENEVLIRS
ncbi:MAG: TATA box-binding protein [Candidatus Bathyarchaeota archaeon]|nr:TATA box-binding protein [Candidatus Bathyarchaeota archaeon]